MFFTAASALAVIFAPTILAQSNDFLVTGYGGMQVAGQDGCLGQLTRACDFRSPITLCTSLDTDPQPGTGTAGDFYHMTGCMSSEQAATCMVRTHTFASES